MRAVRTRRSLVLVAAAVLAAGPGTGAGQFGADMQVHLVNDGPVTFWLES